MNLGNNHNRITFNIPEGKTIATYAQTAATISGSDGTDVLPPIMGAFRTKIGASGVATFNIALPNTNSPYRNKSPYSHIELKGVITKENQVSTAEGFHFTNFHSQVYTSTSPGGPTAATRFTAFWSPNGGYFSSVSPSVIDSIQVGDTNTSTIKIILHVTTDYNNDSTLVPYRIKGTYLLM